MIIANNSSLLLVGVFLEKIKVFVRVTVSGELIFWIVTVTVTSPFSFYDVTKQFLIMITEKHLNSPAVNC